MSSLVNQMEKPTLWSEGEGRWMHAGTTEMAGIDSRGSRDGMLAKIYCPVLEAHSGGWGGHRLLYKETKAQRPHTGVGGAHSTV